ncbi:MAG: galactokinase [Solirubrobacteraceae bacterium]|nr:galactokinase [Solirubrobacteraceae bacterium]
MPPQPTPTSSAARRRDHAARLRPVRAFGPGRVNLIGEHTDYNDGLCLPFAIEAGVTVEASEGPQDAVRVVACDLGEEDVFALSDPQAAEGWRAFARGMVAELQRAGHPLRPATLTVRADVPRGSGLSSSAALEVSLALALLAHSGTPEPDRHDLARLCSRVENEWVGAQTGLLDQLAALFGRQGHAVRLDMRTLDVEPVALDLGDWKLVAVDSGVRHWLAGSGYNERRRECHEACERLGITSLRDATPRDVDRLPDPLDRRVRHVIDENARVDQAVAMLGDGDLPGLARLLDASHASLRDLYEVSVPEVERTVERVKAAGAAGARIVGGGFGGSVLALFPPRTVPPADALRDAPGPSARLLEP